MHAVTPVSFTTPDGVERKLRATAGARKRIIERFNKPISDLLGKEIDNTLPGIAYAMMYDEKGRPPDIQFEEFYEMLPMDAESSAELFGIVMSAFSRGKLDPNETTALVQTAMKGYAEMNQTNAAMSTGLISTDSALSASDSPTSSSGTGSLNAKSEPDPEPTEKTEPTSTAA